MSEKDVEKMIKQKFSTINPPRSAFTKAMENVTSKTNDRYIERGNQSVLSPYQSISHFFMKKVLIIGIPVTALALVAIVTTKSDIWTKPVPISENIVSGIDGSEITNQTGEGEQQSLNSEASAEKTIDDVFAAIISDIEADEASLSSEEEDVTTINTEIQNYNNVKNTNYEDLI